MNICKTRGHKYYPTVRRVTTSYVFGSPITTEENVLYCARCADVVSLDANPPAIKYTPYGTWSIKADNYSASGWTYLNLNTSSGTDAPDPL